MKSRLIVAAFAVAAIVVAGSLRAAEEAKALKCPVSGKAASADHKVAFNGGEVAFCCGNCPKAFAKNQKKYAAKANLQLVQTKQLKQVKCPLTGKPVDGTKLVEVAGVKICVCCGGCLGKMNKLGPDEQVEALLSDTSKGFEPAK